MNTRIALDLKDISDLIADSKPGITIPAALSDETLNAAIHDLHQYFGQQRDVDSEGELFLTGPLFLLRKVLMDKGILVPGAVILEFLSQYQLELQIEFMKRLDPGLPIERATLETIFEPNRVPAILRAITPNTTIEQNSSVQELDGWTR